MPMAFFIARGNHRVITVMRHTGQFKGKSDPRNGKGGKRERPQNKHLIEINGKSMGDFKWGNHTKPYGV